MNDDADIAVQLTNFGKGQLATLRARDITATTVHLILATAFFTGATLHFAGRRKLAKSRYLPALQDFLAATFGLDTKHAAGLVESNARLYQNYTLIEQVYNSGWRSAQQWTQDEVQATEALRAQLHKYRDLSMANLAIEGIKEKPEAPAPAPSMAEPEQVAAPEPAAKPQRRTLPWLMLLALLLVAAVYFSLHPEQLPPSLQRLVAAARDLLP